MREQKAKTIQDAVVQLRAMGYQTTVFSTRERMPIALKGLPDLYLMKDGRSCWVEVKLRHANYMRDQMRDAQWYWYHNRRDDFSLWLRYAIVESAEELLEWVKHGSNVFIPEYHYKRYEEWR